MSKSVEYADTVGWTTGMASGTCKKMDVGLLLVVI